MVQHRQGALTVEVELEPVGGRGEPPRLRVVDGRRPGGGGDHVCPSLFLHACLPCPSHRPVSSTRVVVPGFGQCLPRRRPGVHTAGLPPRMPQSVGPASCGTGTGGRTPPRRRDSATPARHTAPPARASAGGTSSSSSQPSRMTSGGTRYVVTPSFPPSMRLSA